ncbi:UNVERIFIED_CONTAM: hypothetical protein Sradi_0848800 [Sesamum radiatum]|uniref:Uncharacterized protein n=1 Tax=Sesamum radiatum TaxID=300843 RepID=A0AAW2V1L6_SESRA
MCGIDPKVIVHRLNVNLKIRPVKQKKRAFGNERIKAIKEEVEKLLRTDYIMPVQYPEWLANEREDQMSKEILGSWTQSGKVPTGSLKQLETRLTSWKNLMGKRSPERGMRRI